VLVHIPTIISCAPHTLGSTAFDVSSIPCFPRSWRPQGLPVEGTRSVSPCCCFHLAHTLSYPAFMTLSSPRRSTSRTWVFVTSSYSIRGAFDCGCSVVGVSIYPNIYLRM
jgi:hypothetical protein